LPLSVPVANPDDILAQFATDLRQTAFEGVDAYEMFIDRALSNAIGYEKNVEDIIPIIRRGSLGMDGFCQYIEICAEHLRVSVLCLELRLERVCEAMEKL